MAQPHDKSKAKPKKGPSAPNKAFVRKDPEAWKHWGSTSVPNAITRDPDISPEECWAWTWLASHTSTFEVSGKSLWESKTALSKNRAYELLRSLEERGLLLRKHEVNERGVPVIFYDLQPMPVPVEQRTAKARKPAKPKKPFPTKQQDTSDSQPSGNPETTSDDATPSDPEAGTPAFPDGRESGSDQEKHPGGTSRPAGGVFPDESGTSARPAKTDLNKASESDVTSDDDLGGVSPDRSGESYKEEKTKGKDQPTKEAGQPSAPVADNTATGWLAGRQSAEDAAEGARILRLLPYGIGAALSGPCVTKWAPVVEAALRAGMSEQTVIARLTDQLPDDRSCHTKIVVGRRLPDLQTWVEQAPRHSADRAQSAAEQAHAQIDQWIQQGAAGARRAAALRGEYFDPEAQRGNTPAQEWLTERLPAISREFIEQRRESLVQVLTARAAA